MVTSIWDIYINSYIGSKGCVWAGPDAVNLPMTPPVHIITACNPYEKILSLPQNTKRNSDLLHALNQYNSEVLRVFGYSPDEKWKEESFAVSGLSRNQACQIAFRFGQRGIYEILEDDLLVIEVYSQKIRRRRPRIIRNKCYHV